MTIKFISITSTNDVDYQEHEFYFFYKIHSNALEWLNVQKILMIVLC
jgi:hypothetical protein